MKKNDNENVPVLQLLNTALSDIEDQRIKRPKNIYRRGITDGLGIAWLILYDAKRKIEDQISGKHEQ